MKSISEKDLLTTFSIKIYFPGWVAAACSLYYSLGTKHVMSLQSQKKKKRNAVCKAGKYADRKKLSLFNTVRFLPTQTLAHTLFSARIDNGGLDPPGSTGI